MTNSPPRDNSMNDDAEDAASGSAQPSTTDARLSISTTRSQQLSQQAPNQQYLADMLNMAGITAETIPAVIWSVASHFWSGPPVEKWSLKFHVIWRMFRTFLHRESRLVNLDRMQRNTARPGAVSKSAVIVPDSIPRCQEAVDFMLDQVKVKDGDAQPTYLVDDDVVAMASDVSSAIEAEWVWHDPKARQSVSGNADASDQRTSESPGSAPPPHVADPNVPIVYDLHGGAYVVGSIGMNRPITHSIARASSGCVFAINYRLAPQEPFPCAVIDAISGYIYLIRKCSVSPSRIVITGDSAGGGLAVAALMAIRDMGLPRPAGAFLMSPWVDLTHSFPSFLKNAQWDYLPELENARELIGHVSHDARDDGKIVQPQLSRDDTVVDAHESSASQPPPKSRHGRHSPNHLHLYAPNELLKHPYVSPIWQSDLSNLPPMLIQVGSVERLFDEGVHFAEKLTEANQSNGSSFVQLEIYTNHVHVFHIFRFLEATRVAYGRAGEFVRMVTTQTCASMPSSRIVLDHEGYVTETGDLKPRL